MKATLYIFCYIPFYISLRELYMKWGNYYILTYLEAAVLDLCCLGRYSYFKTSHQFFFYFSFDFSQLSVSQKNSITSWWTDTGLRPSFSSSLLLEVPHFCAGWPGYDKIIRLLRKSLMHVIVRPAQIYMR